MQIVKIKYLTLQLFKVVISCIVSHVSGHEWRSVLLSLIIYEIVLILPCVNVLSKGNTKTCNEHRIH